MGSQQPSPPCCRGDSRDGGVGINNAPKKGGTPKVFGRTLKSTVEHPRHLAAAPQSYGNDGGPKNAAPELTANDGESCKGEIVRLSVGAGRQDLYDLPSLKGTSRTYACP